MEGIVHEPRRHLQSNKAKLVVCVHLERKLRMWWSQQRLGPVQVQLSTKLSIGDEPIRITGLF